MITISHIMLSVILLSLIFALNSSRLRILIMVMFLQGALVSIMPMFLEEKISTITAIFILITLTVKGFLIPWLLMSVFNKIKIKKEIEPIIGYNFSMFIALFIIVLSTYLGNKVHFPIGGNLLGITAMATIISGMFLLTSRRKTITQIIGYLMMENGIYLIGITLSNKSRYIVEFGVLLDILVGVMIMVIVLQQINITFHDINSSKLKNLKE
ncbi:hypothetical protein [Haliovirga abyssi]|uniref:Hydrogenase n=1 Tax=Haliovirga abyssi TaxID=2996794 RepID=A0AAU9DG57_9FUSO|nr:hypothetical protein [Haliovirga abyssi]BDU51452.1 hypothetical protein HLVA_20210 [Haliovirga abyssi]